MPRRKREYLLRWWSQAVNDLERCQENLRRLYEIYQDGYPEHADVVIVVVSTLKEAQKTLERFRQDMM